MGQKKASTEGRFTQPHNASVAAFQARSDSPQREHESQRALTVRHCPQEEEQRAEHHEDGTRSGRPAIKEPLQAVETAKDGACEASEDMHRERLHLKLLAVRSVLPSHLVPFSFVLQALAARRLGSGYNAQRGCGRDGYMLKMSSLEC
jgi:hypothetical protein